MDEATQKRLTALETRIEQIYISVEKTRKYFLWIMWGTIVMFVLPLIGLVIVIPIFISSYAGSFSNLGL